MLNRVVATTRMPESHVGYWTYVTKLDIII